MTPGQRAEALIAQFRITDPKDLDVEAIALDAGVVIEYRQLKGCEATLVGVGDKAIATIRPSNVRGRERFSISHELGHWDMHRGRSFRCRVDDPDENLVSDRSLENDADQFAAHLLMPGPLFNPAVKALGNPGFREIEDLADKFQASLLATSIRLANVNTLPAVIACYSSVGLRWRLAGEDVPRRWFLHRTLSEESFAFDLMSKGTQTTTPRKQSAEVWFENNDAEEYELHEHSTLYRNGEILVILYLSSKMLSARFDQNVGGRRYTDKGSYVPPRRSQG